MEPTSDLSIALLRVHCKARWWDLFALRRLIRLQEQRLAELREEGPTWIGRYGLAHAEGRS